MARIFYVGDWAVTLGPVFAETPFNYSFKGLETLRYDHYLREALELSGEHICQSMSAWDFYSMAPGAYEEVLATHDVIIFSDVELKNFQLAPQFFDRNVFGSGVITYPDRVRLTVEAIESGTHAMFLGGWLSFSGEMGKGGWGRSRLAEVLPVGCLATEDLVESTEGFRLERRDPEFLPELDLAAAPPLLGYNRVEELADSTVHVTIAETGDPIVATRRSGTGNVLAYMSDPAPHWGCNFVQWESYASFWLGCTDLLTGDG